MKKLNYLMPDIESGYFKASERKNEHYKYLRLPANLTAAELDEDIKAGAQDFKKLAEHVGKDWQQYMVIDCENYEQGLMAVGYLESICRNTSDGEEECGGDEWYYNEKNIPIIYDYELSRAQGVTYGRPVFMGLGGYQVQEETSQFAPYWQEEGISCVCILVDKHMAAGAGMLGSLSAEQYEMFKGCEHVYIIRNNSRNDSFFDGFMSFDDDETAGVELGRETDEELPDEELFRLLINLEADHLSLLEADGGQKSYHQLVFQNLMRKHGLVSGKTFPIARVVRMIEKIDESYPNTTMDKVLSYIKRNYHAKTLNEKHFKNLGILTEKRNAAQDAQVQESDLVGMEDVKAKADEIITTMQYLRCRSALGMKASNCRNVFLMLGAPGTAKTTMAKILGSRFAKEHFLKGTRFVSLNGAELKGMYLGQTAPKIHSIFEKNDIIFIDEAYSIAANEDGQLDLYSQEALAQLAIELENHGTDRLILFAGYGGQDVSEKNNKMKDFLDANPGIKSRINGTIYFSSYNAKQMVQIVHGIASKMDFCFGENADDLIEAYFAERVESQNFGNGREARSFVEKCQKYLAKRIMQLSEGKRTKRLLGTFTREDVEAAILDCRKENEAQRGRKGAGSYGLACS